MPAVKMLDPLFDVLACFKSLQRLSLHINIHVDPNCYIYEDKEDVYVQDNQTYRMYTRMFRKLSEIPSLRHVNVDDDPNLKIVRRAWHTVMQQTTKPPQYRVCWCVEDDPDHHDVE